jgi:hypothetical protein
MERQNFTTRQGDTFRKVIRWEQPPYVYAAITAILQKAPVRVTAPAHGLTTGWRTAVVSVQGMDEINARHIPPWDTEMYPVLVVDEDDVDINAVNAAEFSPYASGGYLQFWTPVDLTGFTARMQIRDPGTFALLWEMTSEDGGIAIDNTAKTISLYIAASDMQTFDWTSAIYDLEMISPASIHETIFTGNFNLTEDIELPETP